MSTGAWVLVVAVLGALAFGAWRAYADGRFRGTHPVRSASEPLGGRVASDEPLAGRVPSDEPLAGRVASAASVSRPRPTLDALVESGGVVLGERATLLQFSSAFCAPCRSTRRVLSDVATAHDDVTHVEVDAESHLDLVRELGILRTPTTLVLDGSGAEVARAAGAPTKSQVVAQLAALA